MGACLSIDRGELKSQESSKPAQQKAKLPSKAASANSPSSKPSSVNASVETEPSAEEVRAVAKKRLSEETLDGRRLSAAGQSRLTTNGALSLCSTWSEKGTKGLNQDATEAWENFCGRPDWVCCSVYDGHGPFGQLIARKARDLLSLELAQQQQFLPGNHGKCSNVSSSSSYASTFASSTSASSSSASAAPPRSSPHQENDWMRILAKAFRTVDDVIRLHRSIDPLLSGSTAALAILQGSTLVVANIGDTQAVLASRREAGGGGSEMVASLLTTEHKCCVEEEKARIEACRGRVFPLPDEQHVQRIWLPAEMSPGLVTSRAFGDVLVKDFGVTVAPALTVRQLVEEEDEFVILATDGVWDVLSADQAVSVVEQALLEQEKEATAATAACGEKDSAYSNMYTKPCMCSFTSSTSSTSTCSCSLSSASSDSSVASATDAPPAPTPPPAVAAPASHALSPAAALVAAAVAEWRRRYPKSKRDDCSAVVMLLSGWEKRRSLLALHSPLTPGEGAEGGETGLVGAANLLSEGETGAAAAAAAADEWFQRAETLCASDSPPPPAHFSSPEGGEGTLTAPIAGEEGSSVDEGEGMRMGSQCDSVKGAQLEEREEEEGMFVMERAWTLPDERVLGELQEAAAEAENQQQQQQGQDVLRQEIVVAGEEDRAGGRRMRKGLGLGTAHGSRSNLAALGEKAQDALKPPLPVRRQLLEQAGLQQQGQHGLGTVTSAPIPTVFRRLDLSDSEHSNGSDCDSEGSCSGEETEGESGRWTSGTGSDDRRPRGRMSEGGGRRASCDRSPAGEELERIRARRASEGGAGVVGERLPGAWSFSPSIATRKAPSLGHRRRSGGERTSVDPESSVLHRGAVYLPSGLRFERNDTVGNLVELSWKEDRMLARKTAQRPSTAPGRRGVLLRKAAVAAFLIP